MCDIAFSLMVQEVPLFSRFVRGFFSTVHTYSEYVRAGSTKRRKIPPSGNNKRNTLFFATLKISTRPHEQGEHIGEAIFVVRVVVREIWTLAYYLGRRYFT